MKKVKDVIKNFINGFFMALADSVPGVSGGTVAFILGFYDKFINSLDDLFRGSFEKKKEALIFLIKIGIGWVIGYLLAASVLANLFTTEIYLMSSLFIGFIIFAIPLVLKEENVTFQKNKIGYFIFGLIVVIAITLLTQFSNLNINISKPNLGTLLYVFIVGAIAITAMVLPGISGSTLLLIFGIYVPIITSIKTLLTFDLSVLPVLISFGFGVLFGIIFFVRLIRKALEKDRMGVIYFVLGMMIASVYSIIMGPTLLEEPVKMLTFETFSIVFFIIGGVIIFLLEKIKNYLNK